MREAFYQKFEAYRVPGEIIKPETSEKQEEDRLPFISKIDNIPTFSVLTAGENKAGGLRLEQPTEHHGRDLQMEGAAIWGDQFDNIYGSLNTKGNKFDNIHVETDKYNPSGYKLFGLFPNDVLDRTCRASRFLREKGVETEKIEQVVKPQKVVVAGQEMTVDELKRKMVEDARSLVKSGEERTGLFSDQRKLTEEDLPKIEDYLEKTDLVFIVRSLQVTERIRDLSALKTREQFEEMIGRVFRFINLREKIEAEREKKEPQHFSVEKPEDIKVFLTNFLPKRCARNLARLHNQGLAHGWPTDANFSLAGSLYDLDSVRGKKLYDTDQAVGIDDIKDDLTKIVESINSSFKLNLHEKAAKKRETGNEFYFKEEWGKNSRLPFIKSFYTEYLNNRDISEVTGGIVYEEFENKAIDEAVEAAKKSIAEEKLSVDEIFKKLAEEMEQTGQDLSAMTFEGFIHEVARKLDNVIPRLESDGEITDYETLEKCRHDFATKVAENMVQSARRRTHQEIYKEIADRLQAS